MYVVGKPRIEKHPINEKILKLIWKTMLYNSIFMLDIYN